MGYKIKIRVHRAPSRRDDRVNVVYQSSDVSAAAGLNSGQSNRKRNSKKSGSAVRCSGHVKFHKKIWYLLTPETQEQI
jgi:hypothetical protein